MKLRLLLVPAAVLGTAAIAHGTAAANAYTADADCAGLTVDLPRGEDGTTVTAYLNGNVVRQEFVAVFGEPVRFSIPSPDSARPQAWRVTVIGHNGPSAAFAETVPACTSSTVTSVTSPPSTPTVPAATVVDVTTPPVPSAASTSTTVVSPPRTPTSTTVIEDLPATGGREIGRQVAAALAGFSAGIALVLATRRRAARS